jgi:hypothetical protein
MSRSGYDEDYDCEDNTAYLYRGAVTSALKGRRGQAFLHEMLQAMAALPEKKLIDHDLQRDGAFCAIGTVGKARGIDMTGIDPENIERVARMFGIAESMAREIVYMNDEFLWANETPEQRFERMRKWIESELYEKPATQSPQETERAND